MILTKPLSVEIWPLSIEAGVLSLLGGQSRTLAQPENAKSILESARLSAEELSHTYFIHSTSWREEESSVVLTFVALCDPQPLVNSVSISSLLDSQTRPTSDSLDYPELTSLDVLNHALQHLAFLLHHDQTFHDQFAAEWLSSLNIFAPKPAGSIGPVQMTHHK